MKITTQPTRTNATHTPGPWNVFSYRLGESFSVSSFAAAKEKAEMLCANGERREVNAIISDDGCHFSGWKDSVFASEMPKARGGAL